METKIAIFKTKEIRKRIFNNEWWFVVEDVVFALTDSVNVKDYIKKMRRRDEELAKGWGQFVTPLEIETKGGVYFGTAVKKTIDLKVILALLNSKLLSAVYQFLYSGMHMGGGYLRYRTNFLEELPFSEPTNNQGLKIISLVDSILNITKDDDYLQNPKKRQKSNRWSVRLTKWFINYTS